jgi:hypothetical protein
MGRNNKDFHGAREGITPSKEDVNYATKYGKITREQAKDLRPEDESFTPSIYSGGDPAEYQESRRPSAAEPDSPKMTAALRKSKSAASRANIRDILG